MMSGVIYVDSRMPSFIHSLDGPVKCLNRYWWPVKCQELQRCWGWSKVPITRVFSDLFPASPLLCLVTGITSIGYMLPWGQPWQLAHSWLQPTGALGKLETRGQEKLGELASLLTALSPSPLPLLSLRWCLQQWWDLLQTTISIPGPSRPRFPSLSNLWVSLRWSSWPFHSF